MDRNSKMDRNNKPTPSNLDYDVLYQSLVRQLEKLGTEEARQAIAEIGVLFKNRQNRQNPQTNN